MRSTAFVLLLSALLAACGEDPKETADTAQEPAAPQEGTWNILFGTTTANTCESDVAAEDPGDVEVAMTGTDTLTITDVDGAFTCTLVDIDYTCSPRETGRTSMDPLAAELVATVTLTGSFPTWSTTTGNAHIVLTCEGDDCTQVEATAAIPCEADVDFSGAPVIAR